MDNSLQALLDTIMNEDGVQGVLVADEQGLCLAARGVASALAAGFVAAVAGRALELAQVAELVPLDALATAVTDSEKLADMDASGKTPTARVDSDNFSIYIRSEGTYTLAVYR